MLKTGNSFSKTKIITATAMLTAISVVIGIICKNFFTFNVYYRITFENLPIIIAGITFGPMAGALCGICADIVSCLCSANPSVIPLITVGAACVGMSSGLVAKYIIKKPGLMQYSVAAVSAHLIGQVGIKSIAKILWLGMPAVGIFIGLAVSAVVVTLEIIAINLIMKKGILSPDSKRNNSSKGV